MSQKDLEDSKAPYENLKFSIGLVRKNISHREAVYLVATYINHLHVKYNDFESNQGIYNDSYNLLVTE